MYKICKTEESASRQRELNIPRKTFFRYSPSKEDALLSLGNALCPVWVRVSGTVTVPAGACAFLVV